MPSTISLRNLSYFTPDGKSLFSDLTLAFGPHRTGLIGRNGVGKSTLLQIILGQTPPASGEVQMTGRLAVLRQTVQVRPTDTLADAMGVRKDLDLLARAEAGTTGMDELADADWLLPARLETALAQFGLGGTPLERPFDTLSGGQRTRVALAGLIAAEPDFVLLDEPTNNLDTEGRKAVVDFLAGWKGGALVVSHDRDLLETMDAIVELTTLGATTYGGNWSHYRERKAIELASAQQNLATAERKIGELDRKIQTQKERKARRDAAGQRKAAKGDMPRILLGGMKENAENSSGESANLASRQREQAAQSLSDARAQVEILEKVALRLPSTGLPAGKVVLRVDGLSGGPVPGQPIITNLSFSMTGPERLAIVGPNGSGKTSLLRLLTGDLPPEAGSVWITPRHAVLDQTVSILDPGETIRDNFRRLNPRDDENTGRAALARFLFRADAALQPVGSLSGGQMLRAALACVLGGSSPPELLVLDEPTNHLDIEAIEAVEAGLAGYDGAMIVVSHDPAFLAALGIERKLQLGQG